MPAENNGTWRLVALLIAGGTIGGGAGTIGGAFASDEKIRRMIEVSPDVAVVRTVQAEIRADDAELRDGQKEIRVEQQEIQRKLDRVLVVIEREAR